MGIDAPLYMNIFVRPHLVNATTARTAATTATATTAMTTTTAITATINQLQHSTNNKNRHAVRAESDHIF